MSMLNRKVTFGFKDSDLRITVGVLENIIGLRSQGRRPSVAEFNFRVDEQLTARELTWIEQCVKPALDKDSCEIRYKESKCC